MEPEQTPTPDGEDAAVGNSGLPGLPDDEADTIGMSASPVATVLDAVSAQLRLLQTAPTLTLSDGELRDALIAAHRVANQVEAAVLHLVRAVDDRPEAMPTCAPGKVAATFLVHALRIDPGTAARDVAAARALDQDGAGVGVDTGHDGLGPDGAATLGLPEVGAALAAGDISRRHVDHATGCLGRIDKDVLTHIDPDGISGVQRVDEFLAEMARKHAPHVFRRLCTQLEEALNPDQGFDPKAHEKRYLHLGTDSNGMLIGRFALSPADGLIVRNVIHALSKPTKVSTTTDTEADAEAGGDGQVQGELPLRDPRTAAQRRADALTHLAHLALHRGSDPDTDEGPPADPAPSATSTPTDTATSGTDTGSGTKSGSGKAAGGTAAGCGGASVDGGGSAPSASRAITPQAAAPTTRPVPTTRRAPTPPPSTGVHISLIATLDQLTAALRPTPTPGAGLGSDLGPGGGPLPRHVLAQNLCTALISPTLLDSGGAVLAQGRAQRLATPAQRRAVFARDRGCIIPGCTAPADWCDVHHVTPWADGGLTDVDKMALVCNRDHTAVHVGIWTIQMINGAPWVIPPAWIDPHQQPVRNTLHDDEHTAHQLARHLGEQLTLDLDTGSRADWATGQSDDDEPRSPEWRPHPEWRSAPESGPTADSRRTPGSHRPRESSEPSPESPEPSPEPSEPLEDR
ncbi:MAG: DUF222 domain-containing protein [Kineosporiaceae bacterium]|nr:DUF222 domain-containing protein [Kineosporiaceae bacterium]